MKTLAFLGGAAALGLGALLVSQQTGHAADHLDSLALATNPMADINDVYVWNTPDATKVNLAMTVSPADPGNREFGPAVQYVFHAHSKTGLGVGVANTGTETQVTCTFASNTAVQCWVTDASGTKDYVSGDPSSETGLTSASGKMKVFAGRRSDPFFFNLQGFRTAVSTVKSAAPGFTYDAGGAGKCPNNLPDATVGAVRGMLAAQHATVPTDTPPCPDTNKDCFAALKVMVLVVQVDKTLLNSGANTSLGVWASTHTGS